ncbi:MAG: hypothetical protein ACREC6_05345, partial [Hyphomicrobiaceae bacterium]
MDAVADWLAQTMQALVRWLASGHAHWAVAALLAAAGLLALVFGLDRYRLVRERRKALAFGEAEIGRTFRTLGAMHQEIGKILEGLVAKNRELEKARQDLLHQGQEAKAGAALQPLSSGGDVAGIYGLAFPFLFAVLSLLSRDLKDLAGDADLSAVDEVLHLQSALDSLAAALDAAVAQRQPNVADAIAGVLEQGLKDRWLDRLVRSELVLSAYAPPGSGWSRLAQTLRLLVAWIETALAESKKMEIVSHPLLAPVNRRVRA